MNKVAIASCYFQKNYGSMLQAFATQQAIENLGYKTENICIDGIAKEIRNAKLKYYAKELTDWSVIKTKMGFVRRFVVKRMDNEFRKNVVVRDKKFNNLYRSYYYRYSIWVSDTVAVLFIF